MVCGLIVCLACCSGAVLDYKAQDHIRTSRIYFPVDIQRLQIITRRKMLIFVVTEFDILIVQWQAMESNGGFYHYLCGNFPITLN